MMFFKPNSSKSLNKQKEKLDKYISFNNDQSPTSKNNYLCLPKQNNNVLCLTPHSQNNNNAPNNKYASNFNLTPNNIISNISFMQKNLIHEKIEQYKLHPFRRLNLKMVGEDIKQKLIEMHEEDSNLENEKTCSSPTETKKMTKVLKDKYNISNDSIINLDFSNKKRNSSNAVYNKNFFFDKDSYIFEKDENKTTSCSHVVKLKIPKLKIKDNENSENKNNEKGKVKKTDIKNIKSLNSKISAKYRKIQKIKNLYDSMDDHESDEDIEGDVINPETKYILIFDLLIIILYIYTFFIITINLSTTKCFCSYNNNIFNDIIFYFTDILYILDLIISFFRSFYNFEYKLIKVNRLIIKNYLTGDFFLDLLEAIPIFSISKYLCFNNSNYYNCYEYEMASLFIFLKTASMIKVFKIIKILGRKKNQALDNFLELISENYTIERTSLLIIDSLLFIGIIHCFVCFHIFIGKHSYSNWILQTSAENESLYYIYIESLYFLITTLTTVGYGDITCHSFGERIFHILLLAVGSIFYSYIISTIGNYIKNDSHAKIKYNNDLNILENIRIAYPNMPFKLYKNINKYLESKSSSQEKYDVNLLIDTLPFTLKNTILFTMYKSVIKNFKFFKNNDNSEFIARVLTNFIPVISKKNEFLIYEGEIVEEIIFIKDGRISLNAAINLEDPSKSIDKYFNEKFSPFTSDEERKLLESRLNDNNLNKSAYVSVMKGDITYDTAKTKINNAFKTIKNNLPSDDKSVFLLNNNYQNNDSNELGKFDINGGAIKNEDGNYQYLKIIDIRKNEHFGCVFMTLKKPCPLSLQVKSKFAEFYFFKKEEAIATSKSYPNIWKKLYRKEFHNLRAIKNMTFNALKKYIEINQLLLDLNLDDHIGKNDLTINDLNELEKSLFSDKSLLNPLHQASRKSISGKKELQKYKTMNSEFDKKQKRLSLGGIYVQNQKDRLSSLKNKYKGGNLYSNSIIYTNKDKLLKLVSLGSNNSPFFPNKKPKNPRVVHFADELSNRNKNERFLNDISFHNKNNTSKELYTTEDNDNEKKSKINKNRTKSEKLKKLKNILTKFKNNLKNQKYEEYETKKTFSNQKSNEIGVSNFQRKKGILKDNKSNDQLRYDIKYRLIENSNNKLINIQKNNNKCDDSLIQDLKNICNEETNFSFCSIKDEKNFNLEDLSISNDINLEIVSSYENLNKISKGKYIYDYFIQNKIKVKIKKYYNIEKSINEDSLSLNSLYLSSDSKENNKLNKRKSSNLKKTNKKNKSKKSSKKKLIKKNYISQKVVGNQKEVVKINKKEKKCYDSEIKSKIKAKKSNKSKENQISNNITFKNDTSQNLSPQNSIKVNLSSNNIDFNNNSSNFSKKNTKNIFQDESFDIDIKENKHVYNINEAEYEINKNINKSNIPNIFYNNNTNNIINNNSNKNIYLNNNIYKKKSGNNKNKKNSKETKIINQILGIQIPNSNIITNNITTTSSKQFDNKDNFNTNEKINNIEASFSIYNIIQKNVNKNLNIIDGKENLSHNNLNRSFCNIF